ncbi:MAG: single-stranded DNA-binding protein [Actinomycetota bacterium]|nr:MAG: single-stranded DNA-binding protein [Actinomycetota bacterium]
MDDIYKNKGGFMGQLNQIGLLGNLTRDPELKFTNEGVAICDLGLAINRKWTDKEGQETENVDFFNISCWNSMAENCAASLKKGDRVLISGHMNLRSWENKEGKKFNIINITADVIAASLEFNKIVYDKEDADFIREDEGSKKKQKVKV